MFHDTIVRHGVTRSYKLAGRTVALSRSSAESMRLVFPGLNPLVIPNGVDLDFFTPPDERRPLAGREIRLLFVGNLSRRKGADLLVPIMERLGERFVLHCASKRDGARSVPKHPRIHSLGSLSLEGVRAAYRDSDILVLPSRLEGMPRVVVEAMACALPVVASRASSMPELVRDGVTGRTCAPDEPADFARAIAELVRSQDEYDAHASASRREALENHDLRRMARTYAELCAELRLKRPD